MLQGIPISTFVGHWVQSSNNREIMCSQASDTTVKCLWSDNSGNVISQNFTVQGASLSHSSITGNYSGNGAITWTGGSKWEKQGNDHNHLRIDNPINKESIIN